MKPFQSEGLLAWVDLKTPRIDTTKAFYGGLFGWRFKEELLPGRVMTKMHSSVSEWGSLTSLDSPVIPKGAKPHTSLYFNVEDVDASIAKVKALGGIVLVEPFDIMNLRLSTIQDPTGAVITLQSAMDARHVSLDMAAEGMPGWLELTTTNLEVSGEFYSKLFGWILEYRNHDSALLFHQKGPYEDGITVTASKKGTKMSEWKVYYAVQDCDQMVFTRPNPLVRIPTSNLGKSSASAVLPALRGLTAWIVLSSLAISYVECTTQLMWLGYRTTRPASNTTDINRPHTRSRFILFGLSKGSNDRPKT